MKKTTLFILCLLQFWAGTAFETKSQNPDYARYIIERLSSQEFYGRGYVNYGSKQASQFIARQFSEKGVMPFTDSYSQEFTIPVNTFPGTMMLNISGKALEAGADFIVQADCPEINRVFDIRHLDSTDFVNAKKLDKVLRKDLKNTLLSFDKKLLKGATAALADSMLKTNFPGAGGYLLINSGNRLTWSVSPGYRQLGWPVVEVLEDALPAKREAAALTVDADFFPEYRIENISGVLKGNGSTDSLIVITAHYDHLGMMGRDAMFPGANDNASGIAMMLDIAGYYGDSANRAACDMIFIAFAGEEMGLKGSEYFAANPLFPLDRVKLLINLDMVGTGSEGITVVNGTIFRNYYDRLVKINAGNEYILKVAERGESCNSDHCPFYRRGVPAIFIYSLGKEYLEYHNIYDQGHKVPLSEYEDIFRLLRDFINSI